MKRDMELMEVEEVRLNDKCLRSYAEEINSPLCGIIRGNLVQECLIQVEKLKVDLIKEKLLVNKILANGLFLAILAASPTIGVSSLGLFIIYKLVNKSEHKDRRLARKRLLQHIEWRLNEVPLQRKGQHVHKEYWHGLLLYTLYQLYKATERPAKATHEWQSVS